MPPWVRRIGESALAVIAIGSILSAFILAFGGHIPPYQTYADAQTVQQSIAEQFKKTADTLKEVGISVNSLNRRLDRNECKDLVDKMVRAKEALDKDRFNILARDSLETVIKQMSEVSSGCTNTAPNPR